MGPRRASAVAMGGFEQKNFALPGARLALLVSDGEVAASALPNIVKAEEGVKGIVYGLSGGRAEIVVEGEREALDKVVAQVRDAAGGEASLRERWQLPVGGYDSVRFVELAPKMRAKISISSEDAGIVDYIARHVQIEAVFNRGLTCTKSSSRGKLLLDAKGNSARLKSFVRWCYQGPSLGRPDEVTVQWSKP